ncbi:hypothetical protein ACIQU4_39110 [Streptomyces sp. NPDC090741]|uniref:hypothetical protein n=1 Tax=Streptomyces sp. NPDC090741 TaxID=3365967 RepID=UPI0038228263
MPERPTIDQAAPRCSFPAAGNWRPQRGDLATDITRGRTGVVVSLPEDTGTRVYLLRPEGGGADWAAHRVSLVPATEDPGSGAAG